MTTGLAEPPAGAAPVFDAFDEEAVRARLARFVEARTGGPVGIGRMRRYTVGFSWVTYGFTATFREDGAEVTRELVLRVGPPTGIFAPYRAEPEFRTLAALSGSGVPVPRVHWFCEDPAVLGAPFFVCARVEGEAPVPWTASGGPAFDEATRRALGAQFLDALAALHTFRWQGTAAEALDGERDPARTARAEVEDWERCMRGWSRAPHPMLEWAVVRLKAIAPAAQRVAIVHGDFRIGNFLRAGERITAILDWETVHLGDPLEDIGWIRLKAWRGRSPYLCHLFTGEELAEGYAARTGLSVDPAAVAFWEAFGTFRLAVIHLAAEHAFAHKGCNDMRLAGMAAQIPRVVLQVEKAVAAAVEAAR